MSYRGFSGRGVRRKPGEMNGLESRYAKYLEEQRLLGTVLWYEFDCVKLRLADKTFYTPDFLVLMSDLTLEVHEVKGHWEDDARVKVKVAADKFPLKFKATQFKNRQWVFEEF